MKREPQLEFFTTAPVDPTIAYLISLLQDGAWKHSQDIVFEVAHKTGVKWTDKKVRDLAAAAVPHVISGQLGYKLTKHAAPDEVKHFVNWTESQARKMLLRAEAVRRFAHQIFG